MRLSLAAMAVVVALVLGVIGIPAAAAATNLVSNPSGAGGNTTPWLAGRANTGDTITSVQIDGQSWLHLVSPKAGGYDWAVYKFPVGVVSAGTQYACAFEAMGTGTAVFAMFYDGKNLNNGTIKALSNTPQLFMKSATVVNPAGPAEIQVRTNDQGAVSIYFNEVTCVQGSSVTIPLSTATVPSIGSSSSTASSASSSVTSSGTSQATGSASQKLPSTGQSPLVPVVGALLVIAGSVLGLRARHSTSGV